MAELVEELWDHRKTTITSSTDTHSSQDEIQREHVVGPKEVSTHRPRSSKNIVLNIWDFSGQATFYTTHQVTETH